MDAVQGNANSTAPSKTNVRSRGRCNEGTRSVPAPRAVLRVALAFCIVAFIGSPLALGQQDHARALSRFQEYLARKPYHEMGFDKLVESAIALNQLEALVREYEGRIEENEHDSAARVILARLYGRTDQSERALELLDGVASDEAGYHVLRGELLLERRKVDDAVAALDRAAELSKERRALERIHRKRGEAYLTIGKRDEAARAFRTLAELDPTSFPTRLEVATTLAHHRLVDEAISEFQEAERLAGSDAANRCRVLAERGRLHERESQLEEAVTCYETGIELMGRGNWLRVDLENRLLALHQRTGRIDTLVDRLTEKANTDPQDLGSREFLARVYDATARPAEAEAILAAAIRDFPDDPKLGHARVTLLKALDRSDDAIAEYQRLIQLSPTDVDLYVELGKLFATSDQLEQARREWQRVLDRELTDTSLCLRIAQLFAFHRMHEDAARLYERAIEIEPQEIRHYGDYASYLARRQDDASLTELLERAERAAGEDAERLEQVAHLWREHREVERAYGVLGRALAARPDDPRLLLFAADLELRTDRSEAATASLHRVVDLADTSSLRVTAVERIVRLFRRQGRVGELIEAEERAIAAEPNRAAPALVLGHLYLRERRVDEAAAVYSSLVERFPEIEEAQRALAEVCELRGEYERAIAIYTEMAQKRPQTRRRYLTELARVYLDLFEREKAFACFDEILAASPDNPAVFAEVADSYRRLNYPNRAIECLRQASRLAPENPKYHLELSELYQEAGDLDRAEAESLLAVRSDEERDAEAARARYYSVLSQKGELTETMERLAEKIANNPYDVESPLTLADLYVRELEYELALDMLDRMLKYTPNEPRLMRTRADILFEMGRFDEAREVLTQLLENPELDATSLQLDIASCHIESGQLDEARAVVQEIPDANRVARLFRRYQLFDDAIALLEVGATRNPRDPRLMDRLARAQREKGDLEAAIASFQRVLALRGDRFRTLEALGDCYHKLGRKEEAAEIGERLFALVRVEEELTEEEKDDEKPDDSRSYVRQGYWGQNSSRRLDDALRRIETYYNANGLGRELGEAMSREAVLQPTNQVLLGRAISQLRWLQPDVPRLLEMLESVKEQTVGIKCPPDHTLESWREYLEQEWVSCLAADNETLAKEIDRLRSATAEPGAPAESFVLLAQLLNLKRVPEEMHAALQAGSAQHPDSVRLRIGLAQSHLDRDEFESALEHFRAAEAQLARVDDSEELDRRREIRYRRERVSMEQALPYALRRRAPEEEFRLAFEAIDWATTSPNWRPGSRPGLDGVRFGIVRTLFELERDDEAVALLESLEPESRAAVSRWSSIASLYFSNDHLDHAESIYRRLLELREELFATPTLAFLTAQRTTMFQAPTQRLAALLERRNQHLDAYDLLRSQHEVNAAQALLEKHDLFEEAKARYSTRLEEAESALETSPESERERWRDAVRTAGIQLAEIHQHESDFEGARAIYERLLAQLPNDFSLMDPLALLLERENDIEGAIALHFRSIEAKRGYERSLRGLSIRVDDRIAPIPLAMSMTDQRGARTWERLRQGSTPFYFGATTSTIDSSITPNYADIVRLRITNRETGRAAQVLRDLAREDGQTFRNFSYSIRDVLRSYDLGPEGLPLYRMLHNTAGGNSDYYAMQFVQALEAAQKFDEAYRVTQSLLRRRGGLENDYYRNQAQETIDRLERRLGIARDETAEELIAAVEREPKNGKLRLRLLRRLVDDHRFEEALALAEETERVAPQLTEAADVTLSCLRALGRFDALIARLEEERKRADDDRDRTRIAFEIARMYEEKGEFDAARQYLDALFESAGDRWNRYSLGNWAIQQGHLERAVEFFHTDLERYADDVAQLNMTKQSLAVVLIALGRPEEAVRFVYEQYPKASTRPEYATLFSVLLGFYENLPDLDEHEERLRAAARERGGRIQTASEIALEIALGRFDAAEARLAPTLGTEDGEYLYPVAFRVAEIRGDRARMSELLDQIEVRGLASEVSYVAGINLTEKDVVRALRASLLHQSGDREAALEAWRSLVDDSRPMTGTVVAEILRQHREWQEATRLLEEQREKNGNTAEITLALAEVAFGSGDVDRGLELLAEHSTLTQSRGTGQTVVVMGSEQSMKLEGAYRKADRLGEYRHELASRLEKDPKDIERWQTYARVSAELGEEQGVRKATFALRELAPTDVTLAQRVAELHLRDGEDEDAIALLAALLESTVDKRGRQTVARTLTKIYERKGDWQRADETWLRQYDDPGAPSVQFSLVRRYLDRDSLDDAARTLEAVAAITPDDPSLDALRARLHEAREEWRAALEDRWEEVFDPARSLGRLDSQRPSILWAAEKSGDESSLRSVAADAPRDAILKAALLDYYRRDLTTALSRVRAQLERDPEDLLALDLERLIVTRQEDLPRALALTRSFFERCQRIYQADNGLRTVVREVSTHVRNLEYLSGDFDALRLRLRTDPTERWNQPYEWAFRVGNVNLRRITWNEWDRLGDIPRALEAWRTERLLQNPPQFVSFPLVNAGITRFSSYSGSTGSETFEYRALDAEGRRSEATEKLWSDLRRDAARAQWHDESVDKWLTEAETPVEDPRLHLLVDWAKQDGTLAMLDRQLEEFEQSYPDHPGLAAIRSIVPIEAGDPERAIERLEKESSTWAPGSIEYSRLRGQYIAAGRCEDALRLARRFLQLASASAISASSSGRSVIYSSGAGGTLSRRLRFAWGGGMTSNSYSSLNRSFSSRSVSEFEAEGYEAALLSKLGRTEEAEQSRERVYRQRGHEQLVRAYAELELWPEVDALYERALTEDDADAARLLRAWKELTAERPDSAKSRALGERLLAELQRQLHENPYSSPIVEQIAWLHLELGDEAAAEHLVSSIRDAESLFDGTADRIEGWIALRRDDLARASEKFARARRLARMNSWRVPTDLEYGEAVLALQKDGIRTPLERLVRAEVDCWARPWAEQLLAR